MRSRQVAMRPRSSAVSAVFFPPFPFHPFFSSSSSQNGNRARARARADALQQCWMEKAVQLQFHKMFTNQISDLVEALMHAKFVNHDLSHVRNYDICCPKLRVDKAWHGNFPARTWQECQAALRDRMREAALGLKLTKGFRFLC